MRPQTAQHYRPHPETRVSPPRGVARQKTMSRPDISDLSSTDSEQNTDCNCGTSSNTIPGLDDLDIDFAAILLSILRPNATFSTIGVFAIGSYFAGAFLTILGMSLHALFLLPAALIWFASTPAIFALTFYVLYVKFNSSSDN